MPSSLLRAWSYGWELGVSDHTTGRGSNWKRHRHRASCQGSIGTVQAVSILISAPMLHRERRVSLPPHGIGDAAAVITGIAEQMIQGARALRMECQTIFLDDPYASMDFVGAVAHFEMRLAGHRFR